MRLSLVMSNRPFLSTILLCALICPCLAKGQVEPKFEQELRPVLETYCFKCHGQGKTKGDVNLTTYADAAAVQHDPKLWRTVLKQVQEREMPPSEKAQPSVA